MNITGKPNTLWKHDIKVDRLFKRFVDDIIEVPFSELEDGALYMNIDGHMLRYHDDGSFDFATRSPLNIGKGNDITTLTKKQWKLFWALVRNEENSD